MRLIIPSERIGDEDKETWIKWTLTYIYIYIIYIYSICIHMYVCMVITCSRGVWINQVRLPILLGSAEKGKWAFPCPRTCLRIWSRETGSVVPSRVSPLILHTQAESSIWCLLTGFLPLSAAASIYLFKPPYVIGSVPSLSRHAIACRWRSLPRVRRRRASK